MRNAILYIILWLAGCMVAAIIIIMWGYNEKKGNIPVFGNQGNEFIKENSSNNIVNELMLSANELNIYGKSSLIEFNNLDENSANELLIQQLKSNPENLYKTILKNKLEKLKPRELPTDFFVRPVPR